MEVEINLIKINIFQISTFIDAEVYIKMTNYLIGLKGFHFSSPIIHERTWLYVKLLCFVVALIVDNSEKNKIIEIVKTLWSFLFLTIFKLNVKEQGEEK